MLNLFRSRNIAQSSCWTDRQSYSRRAQSKARREAGTRRSAGLGAHSHMLLSPSLQFKGPRSSRQPARSGAPVKFQRMSLRLAAAVGAAAVVGFGQTLAGCLAVTGLGITLACIRWMRNAASQIKCMCSTDCNQQQGIAAASFVCGFQRDNWPWWTRRACSAVLDDQRRMLNRTCTPRARSMTTNAETTCRMQRVCNQTTVGKAEGHYSGTGGARSTAHNSPCNRPAGTGSDAENSGATREYAGAERGTGDPSSGQTSLLELSSDGAPSLLVSSEHCSPPACSSSSPICCCILQRTSAELQRLWMQQLSFA